MSSRKAPKFSRFLGRRAQPKTQPQGFSDVTRQGRALPQGEGSFNIANVRVKEVRVSCWLDRNRLRWGLHNGKHTAILYLTINAAHDGEFDIREFNVDLEFSECVPLEDSDLPRSIPAGWSCPVDNSDVYLCQRPAPDQFKDDGRSWKFSAHQLSADSGGLPRIAQWRWSAMSGTSVIGDCGDLFCGVGLYHAGAPNPISVGYQIEGRALASSHGDTTRYRKPFKFSSRPSNALSWRLSPMESTEILSEADLTRLNQEIHEQFHKFQPTTFPLDLLFTPPDQAPLEDPAAVQVVPAGQNPGNNYAPTQIGNNATVFMGNVNFASPDKFDGRRAGSSNHQQARWQHLRTMFSRASSWRKDLRVVQSTRGSAIDE